MYVCMYVCMYIYIYIYMTTAAGDEAKGSAVHEASTPKSRRAARVVEPLESHKGRGNPGSQP